MVVQDIIIYPIKSMGGISIPSSVTNEEGLELDRRMMLIDSTGRFISQRETPKMSLIGCKFAEDGFTFYDKNSPNECVFIPHDVELEDQRSVTVWDSQFKAMQISQKYVQWFNDFLSINSTLVKMNESSIRYKSIKTSISKTLVSLADGYPYLIISQSSLDDLNSRMKEPIPMDRFRPNIVIDECNPYAEEELRSFNIGNNQFQMIKPCARCVITTINQKTGEKLVEPLKTLSSYKRTGNNTYFAMNAICLHKGEIKIGDEISPII